MTMWNDKIHGLETQKSLVDNDVSFDGLKKKIYDERVIVYLLQIQFQNKSIEDNFEQLWNIFVIVIVFDISNFEIFK